jgi:hypothetical protein
LTLPSVTNIPDIVPAVNKAVFLANDDGFWGILAKINDLASSFTENATVEAANTHRVPTLSQ